jgi:DNA-binding MarR family transcriptional regulator
MVVSGLVNSSRLFLKSDFNERSGHQPNRDQQRPALPRQPIVFRALRGIACNQESLSPLLDELGLTYPQYLILIVLWSENALKVSDIGHRLHLDSGTLTPVLKRLETTGLVKRTRRPRDEREVEISLTAEGVALRARALAVRREVVGLLKMSEAQIATLRTDLNAMTENLNVEP